MADRIVHGHDLAGVPESDTAFFLAETEILFHPLARGDIEKHAGQTAGFLGVQPATDQSPEHFSRAVEKAVFQLEKCPALRDVFPYRAPDHLHIARMDEGLNAVQMPFRRLAGRIVEHGVKVIVGIDNAEAVIGGDPADAAGQRVHQILQLSAALFQPLAQRHFPAQIPADADGNKASVPGNKLPARFAQPDGAAVLFHHPVFRAEGAPFRRGLVHNGPRALPVLRMNDSGVITAGFFKKFRAAVPYTGQKGLIDVDERIILLRPADHQGAAQVVAADPERRGGHALEGSKFDVLFSSHNSSIAAFRRRALPRISRDSMGKGIPVPADQGLAGDLRRKRGISPGHGGLRGDRACGGYAFSLQPDFGMGQAALFRSPRSMRLAAQ